MERTLTILKPDSVAAGKTGAILAHLEKEGFRFVALRRIRLTPEQARAFYGVHRERPFYDALVRFMTEGPVVVAALERADAVPHLRRTMGATDSRKADPEPSASSTAPTSSAMPSMEATRPRTRKKRSRFSSARLN